jgi:hypothetical protein
MRAFASAALLVFLFSLSGCYYGPPNMASVVKRRGSTPRLFSQAEVQVDSASSYLVRRASGGEQVRLHYRSVGESYAGGLVQEYFFAVIYLTGQTWFYPGAGLGLIYDRVYAGVFASTAPIRDYGHPWSMQAGCRITDGFTLVVDNYAVLHSGGDRFGFFGDDDAVRRVYRIMPTFSFRDNAIELAPYAFRGARKEFTGFGVTLAATLTGVFN